MNGTGQTPVADGRPLWRRSPRAAAYLTFALGVTLAALAAMWQANDNAEKAASRFDTLAQRATDNVARRLHLYEYGLRGARGAALSAGLETLDQKHFGVYSRSRNIDAEFPGARGIGIIKRVPRADEASFVAATRADGTPDFAIRELAPHAGDRYVILYIEPFARNRQALGLDIASEQNRRTAAETSMRTGTATLTGPITLVQTTGKPQRSFLLLLPIYRPGYRLDNEQQRTDATFGWSYAALVIDEILEGLDFHRDEVELVLRDITDADAQTFFTSPDSDAPAAAGLVRKIELPIFGRVWQAEIRARASFVHGLNARDPRALAAGGIALSALLAVLIHIYAQSVLRGLEVRAEQARRAAIIESSSDAIIAETLDGVVTDWNRGAQRMFGFAPEQAIGRTTAELLLPDARQDEDADIRARIARREAVDAFDTQRLDHDGRAIDVSLAASPVIGPHGRLIGMSITLRDISEAKRAAVHVRELNERLEDEVTERTALLFAALRETETLLRTVHQHAIVSVTDRSGRIIEVNDGFAQISGYRHDELIGQNHSIINSGAHDKAFWADMWQTIAAGQPWHGEICNRAKDGSLYWVNSMIAPFADLDGKIEKYVAIRTDITAAKLAEQRLRASEAFLDRASRVAGVGAWQYDLDPQLITWSAQMYRIHEVEPDFQPVIDKALGFYPPDARREIERALAAAIDTGQGWDIEVRLNTGKGRQIWVRIVGEAQFENGHPLRLVGSMQDITERKRAELELRETSSLLNGALESASEVSIIATDPQLNITVFNAGAERMLGYDRSEMVGVATPALIHDADEMRRRGEELTAALGRPVSGGAVFIEPSTLREPREWTYVHKDGTRIAVSLVVTAMVGADGEIFGYLGVAHDVTRQKLHEDALHSAIERAEQASLAKSQFLANMSHEIRTPMNAVLGLSYLLEQTRLDAEQASTLAKIRVASKSLLSVINDVLDLSKIEAGELTVERIAFNLPAVLRDVCEMAQVQAGAKGIAFSVHTPPDLPQVVESDATRLRQILTNLLSNAIKFTDAGSVALAVERVCGTAHGATLRFSVTDTGIGIAPEVQSRLFSPFAQADASTTRRFGGTGLGLSIVKRLVDLMGGKVSLESTPDIGSTFAVELEFGLGADTEPAPHGISLAEHGEQSLSGLHILVVDDSDINLEVARRLLEREGARVSLAHNGLQAFESVRANPRAFDLVLMDVQMPVLDGHEATRRIRGELGLAGLPVIALTAGALTSERQRARDAGMDDFISKPFELQELVTVIHRHLAPDTAAPTPCTAPEPGDGWPEFAGIDSDDARLRLGGDVALFRTLIDSLIREFAEPHAVPDDSDPQAMAGCAARMHKLKGSASMLGAKDIQRVAGDIEAACRAGNSTPLDSLMHALDAQLRVLRDSVQRDAPPAEPQTAPAGDAGDIDAPALNALISELRGHSLGALDSFAALSPALQQVLGSEGFAQLRECIDTLQFDDAADVLEQMKAYQ
jgi:PAS domain S-box-containing protein